MKLEETHLPIPLPAPEVEFTIRFTLSELKYMVATMGVFPSLTLDDGQDSFPTYCALDDLVREHEPHWSASRYADEHDLEAR